MVGRRVETEATVDRAHPFMSGVKGPEPRAIAAPWI